MLYQADKLLLIAGPCSLENLGLCRTVADSLSELQQKHPELNIVFKGSFDKANRTSITSQRGTGIDDGLKIFQCIKEEYGFKTLTDIHLPEQAQVVSEAVDVLQIPAFMCRQTDLLQAAAETKCVVNVKKGQFLSPQEMTFVTRKLEAFNAKEIWQTERGTSFGYQNLVVDMRSFAIMQENKHPTIIDATHSVQLPGASNGTSGGQREFVPLLARSAIAAGADGLFVETHPNPENALSDSATQLPLSELPTLIEQVIKIKFALRGDPSSNDKTL